MTRTAEIVKRAYFSRNLQGQFMSLALLADSVDLTAEQIREAIRELDRTEQSFGYCNNSQQGDLTPADLAARVRIGSMDVDMIIWW